MTMRAIIADDEQALRDHLKRMLQKLWPDLELCGEAGHGDAARELIRQQQPDIAFLDIRMPGLSGMDVAADAGSSCRFVFITAYDEYAVQAFEHHAIDYLLKPVTEARLKDTISRLKQAVHRNESNVARMLQKLSDNLATKEKQPLQWLRVQDGDAVALIHVDDVAYFKAEDKYTTVRTRQGEKIIRTPLKSLEESLNNDHFWRIHRNAIVNVKWIGKINRHFGGKLTILLKHIPDELTVSRSFTNLFQQM